MTQHIAIDHQGLPIVLIGHSMGSFMAQQFISEHGEALSGVMLPGSSGKTAWQTVLLRVIARAERLRFGPHGRSALIHSLTSTPSTSSFGLRTEAYWLSPDTAEVDKYLADPLCRFQPALQLWIDLLDSLAEIARPERQARIPKELPIYVTFR